MFSLRRRSHRGHLADLGTAAASAEEVGSVEADSAAAAGALAGAKLGQARHSGALRARLGH
jgi:hypothetical protein